jgi:hypothetical protein
MRRVVGAGLLFLVGCSHPPPAPPGFFNPPPRELAKRCTFGPLTTDKGDRIVGGEVMTCPLPTGSKKDEVGGEALRIVAIRAAFSEAPEFIYLPLKDTAPGSFRTAVYYPAPGELAQPREQLPNWYLVRVDQQLDAATLADIRERVEIAKEDRVYEQCKVLVMNVDAATQAPARAQACGTTMAVIDRARATRQAREDRVEARQIEERRHWEALAAQQRMEQQQGTTNALLMMQAFRPPPPAPAPVFNPTVHTNCTSSRIGSFVNTDCTSR